jgi:hypothetical protein
VNPIASNRAICHRVTVASAPMYQSAHSRTFARATSRSPGRQPGSGFRASPSAIAGPFWAAELNAAYDPSVL